MFRPTTVLKKWLNIRTKDSDDFNTDEGDIDSVYDDDGDEEGYFLLLVFVGILERRVLFSFYFQGINLVYPCLLLNFLDLVLDAVVVFFYLSEER